MNAIGSRPLSGVRIIDASHVFAIPYATSLLAQLGAEVIKIQNHVRADVMSSFGPFPENVPGERPWDRVGCLNTVNRGKRGLSLDISKPDGAEVLRNLVRVSDVLAESFTPRVLKKLGLDYSALRAVNPRLVMLSNTGYGHTGPYSEYGSVATSLEGTSGMCWLSGYEDVAPSKVGQSYTDFLACWNAVFAILVSLYRRNRTGTGQWIDLAMYQAGAATLGPQIMDFFSNSRVPARMGNRHGAYAPHGVYPCRGEDRWISIAVDSELAWERLCKAMDHPAWAADTALSTEAGRLADEARIDRGLADWTRTQDAQTLAVKLQEEGIMAAPVQNARDLLHDSQLRSREFFRQVEHGPGSGIGARPYLGVPWKLSASEGVNNSPAPELGEHNRQVLMDLLGYSAEDVESLFKRGIVGDSLPGTMRPLPLEEMRRSHRIGGHDATYMELNSGQAAAPSEDTR
ncbi:MAG: CaiB/BaiF CoA transferase family protein [Burkholderiaceae bacterium]